jgi:hypothetical protein
MDIDLDRRRLGLLGDFVAASIFIVALCHTMLARIFAVSEASVRGAHFRARFSGSRIAVGCARFRHSSPVGSTGARWIAPRGDDVKPFDVKRRRAGMMKAPRVQVRRALEENARAVDRERRRSSTISSRPAIRSRYAATETGRPCADREWGLLGLGRLGKLHRRAPLLVGSGV